MAKIGIENLNRKICKICLEEDTRSEKIISPCKCKGSSKYIHEKCLRLWILSHNPQIASPACEICKHPYDIERDPHGCRILCLKLKENPRYTRLMIILLTLFCVSFSFLIYILINESVISYQVLNIFAIVSLIIIVILTFSGLFDTLRRIYLAKTSHFKIYPYENRHINTNIATAN